MKEIVLTASQICNFWLKVERRAPDECWPWLACKNEHGYGQFGVLGQTVLATHVALTLDGRPRPEGAHALHGDCSNPACVNPAHLRWGSQADNVADMMRLGRHRPIRGEHSIRAKITEQIVREIRASPLSNRKAALHFGIGASTVSHIRSGSRWRHVR